MIFVIRCNGTNLHGTNKGQDQIQHMLCRKLSPLLLQLDPQSAYHLTILFLMTRGMPAKHNTNTNTNTNNHICINRKSTFTLSSQTLYVLHVISTCHINLYQQLVIVDLTCLFCEGKTINSFPTPHFGETSYSFKEAVQPSLFYQQHENITLNHIQVSNQNFE